ncbi:E3 ubiquitin-protein ligase WAV3-like [Silene latifolia]|uniref:E3 ubiquitin-protein ligase WAV3-like n=1 Tax=Silene latifolia TaxID=37657 RepID=UPI003D76DEAC
MGRGWRRALCTTISKTELLENELEYESMRASINRNKSGGGGKLGFFSSISNPSTPRLRVRTSVPNTLEASTNQCSPRSPFAILKNTFSLSKSSCPLCLHSLKAKTSLGSAIYTAECSHAFHFSCIASHVRNNRNSLVCPVCSVTWKDAPFLNTAIAATASAPVTPTGTNRNYFQGPVYNDEDLLPRFNSIPEEECGGQRLCVSPKKVNPTDNNKMVIKRRNVEVKLLPEAALVSGSQSYETYAVVLSVKAPPPLACTMDANRAPVDLVTVLDVSSSMTGSKLQMLKRAMRLVISSLGSADRLSIVGFASAPHRLLPLRRMTSQGQKAARKIIDQLVCGQGSSVSEALRMAGRVLEDRRTKNPVCTIILLSDNPYGGGGNLQETRFGHIEIPVHSGGFGGFRMWDSQPQQDGYAKCVGGLLSVVVQDLRVQLGFASGSAPVEIMAVYSGYGRPSLLSSDSARLGDLYAEEEREMLVELKVARSSVRAQAQAHQVMCVRCSYKDPATGEVVYGRERALLVPKPPSQSGRLTSESLPRVERLRNQFIYTRAVAESRRLVDHGDYTSAHHLITSARALVMQSVSGSGEEYARGLEAELANVHWRKQYQLEKKSVKSHVSDLHGFENARF